MDYDGMIGGMKKMGGNKRILSKPTHMMFVHHKEHMARAGLEVSTLTIGPPWLRSIFLYLL